MTSEIAFLGKRARARVLEAASRSTRLAAGLVVGILAVAPLQGCGKDDQERATARAQSN